MYSTDIDIYSSLPEVDGQEYSLFFSQASFVITTDILYFSILEYSSACMPVTVRFGLPGNFKHSAYNPANLIVWIEMTKAM